MKTTFDGSQTLTGWAFDSIYNGAGRHHTMSFLRGWKNSLQEMSVFLQKGDTFENIQKLLTEVKVAMENVNKAFPV